MRKTRKPIFILGTGRSGTTVLGSILGLHRDVGFLNEPKALWHSALGDDDVLGSFSDQPGTFRMGGQDATDAKIARLRKSYGAFLGVSHSRRVVDKYPELIFRVGFLQAAFENPRCIVVLRNGADTIQSIANWSQKNGTPHDDWWGRRNQKWTLLIEQLVAPDPYFQMHLTELRDLCDHLNMAAVEWIVTMREALRLQAERQNEIHFVRYEDLVDRPEKTLRSILEFCDLTPDIKMINYAAAVLKPGKLYHKPALHPDVASLFDDTMHALGYGADQ